MTDKFKMSMIKVLTFFLGFQINQVKEGTFISQVKYTRDVLEKFGMNKEKLIKTPMCTNCHLDLDLCGTSVDQKVYRSMISFVHLDLILCLVCGCVQDSKSHPNIAI
jgi:hypothetical protein